ncbi:MAG: glycoside hydrolase family 70 protein [Bacillota bacterium]|nr:glycoside hydrolase family 70 protein [Bacillota bacterium]
MQKKEMKRIFVVLLTFIMVMSNIAFSTTKAHAFTSNPELDNRVIFQSFSLYQPYESNMYTELAKKGDLLNQWGVTDIWLPPAYRSFGVARYMEGYAISDRYDLGEFNQGPNNTQATKYGTSTELKDMVNTLHAKKLKLQMDLVPNQMLGLTNREAVYVNRVDSSGNLFKNPYTTGETTNIRADLYLAYTKGGGQGQAKYGYIKEFNKNYFNGTSVQNQGMERVMTDDNGTPYRFFGAGNANNYLPSWLNEAASANKINTVDGYLAVDGWYAAKDAATSDQYWKPMLINYAKDTGYLPYMAKNGYATVDDIINGDNGDIAAKTSAYINAQAPYNGNSEDKSYANDNSGIDNQDQFLFVEKNGAPLHSINNGILGNNEFLLGLDLDNSNPTVQKEQINWMKWLIDSYKFDGFRIDAASHYDKQVLVDEMDVMKEKFGNDLNNHLSYIESYSNEQVPFENANGNGQLAMDSNLFYTMQSSLGKTSKRQDLNTIVTRSTVDRTGMGQSKATPNWSFVTNHDQEKNRINSIMLDLYGIQSYKQYGNETPKSFEAMYDKDTEKKALDIYQADMLKPVKQYAPHNVVSSYAYILTNKDTVPTVYYGDMFKTNGSYMKERTLYYAPIVNLLKARKAFAYGKQNVTLYNTNTSEGTAGKDLIASVRFGTDRNTGVATVIGNNPRTAASIPVNMGLIHANQEFTDATGFNTEKLVTDHKGVLMVPVRGVTNPIVNGYLGVWTPTADKAPTVKMQNVVVYQGKRVTLKPELKNSASKIASVTYMSANNGIATVDKFGVVRGRKIGKTTVTALVKTQDNFYLSSTVPVEVKANSVTLKKNSALIKRGKTTRVTIASSTDTIVSATYASSNRRIAKVDTTGRVTGVNTGKATITATYKTAGGYFIIKKFAVVVVR